LTVPQAHRAVASQIMARWYCGRVPRSLLRQLAIEIEYHQRRNALARMYHDKRTRRLLRAKGIRLKDAIRSKPPD
jgi:hypothetical protein